LVNWTKARRIASSVGGGASVRTRLDLADHVAVDARALERSSPAIPELL
jgi:hypothetical protein